MASVATVFPFHSSPSSQLIQQVQRCLERGGVMVVPTDSFYALAVSPFNQVALERLMQIKGERGHKPFPVLIGEIPQIHQLVIDVPDIGKNLMNSFWPGLLTLVFSAKPDLSNILTGGLGTIGIRQPGHSLLCQLLCRIGPVTGTSANRTGASPALTAADVQGQLGSKIDLILDGGSAPGGAPSTVLQFVPDVRLIREGAIRLSDLNRYFEQKIPLAGQ